MSNGILPLTDETLHLLRTKHQEMQSAHEEVLLQGPKSKFILSLTKLLTKRLYQKLR